MKCQAQNDIIKPERIINSCSPEGKHETKGVRFISFIFPYRVGFQ